MDFDNKRSVENKMAEWLAHPMEFGVQPEVVQYTRTYDPVLITYGRVEIHLVDYKMPNGTIGRGFVNGPLTWSFLGKDVNTINDADLFVAYCGWAWLFPALQHGTVQTDFVSKMEEARFVEKKRKEGLENVQITHRYKIGDSELFEFSATKKGKRLQGAGDLESDLTFESGDARVALPSIYFLLGNQVIEAMQ